MVLRVHFFANKLLLFFFLLELDKETSIINQYKSEHGAKICC